MVGFGGRLRGVALAKQLGPGLVTGAADDDPSGIATYSQTGAQFGYGLLWTMVLTYPLMCAIQLVSAELGRVTGNGLAINMRQVVPQWLVLALVGLLFLTNTINVGADLAAMGAASAMELGGHHHILTIGFAALSLTLQLFVPYKRYVRYLKWLTLVLLSYVAVALFAGIDWRATALGLIWPGGSGAWSTAGLTTIVAILGTTISPYLFFWQAAQEVEEIDQDDEKAALKHAPHQAPPEFKRIRLDTFLGMAVSNVIAIAVILAAAATLHKVGNTTVDSAADAAKALEPVLGKFASLAFALGIVGTGLLAVPVLAGSAAYAVGDSQGWKAGLDHKPWEAIGFYIVIAAATILGLAIDWSPLDPIKALFWSSVINGVISVPIMFVLMLAVSRPAVMGQFVAGKVLTFAGWAATLIMGAAAIAMLVMMVTGSAN